MRNQLIELQRPAGSRTTAWRYCRASDGLVDSAEPELPRNRILIGDALTQLRRLPEASVDCVITSPPYYLLRDYGVEGQIGLEATVTEWVDNLRLVLTEVARVLKPSGSLWLNLGDSYSRHERYGAPPKSLLMAPERLVLALLMDGWTLRNKVIWAKPNPMPHSVGDRLNTAYEPLYFLVRSRRYYFALDEIRTPHRSARRPTARGSRTKYDPYDRAWAGPLAGKNDGLVKASREGRAGHVLGANPGDVWTLSTAGYRGAHFATFPERLITRPILASCPERLCLVCGAPWRRVVTATVIGTRSTPERDRYVRRHTGRWTVERRPGELHPGCDCGRGWRPGVVFDPFFGSGTVGVVAESLVRDWLGIELNPAYAALAEERLRAARLARDRGPGDFP